ncbi:MAG: trypsin-like peptidase domain-containing protein [Candidatus Marinimicrobia bacterium]|nr:trypsin-like peptidase domain-containing protein [Candidatus Neomarinimicrobiota bacterium]MBL7059390.1 trypsin-like peptidase domain-containing protein [Candidatus Neomarinimicrobiota bacterium]
MMKSHNFAWIKFLVLFLFISTGSAQWGPTQSRQNAITRAIESVSPAVASVNVIQVKRYAARSPFGNPFFQQFFPYELYRQRVKSSGSGVVISPDGYVLTNNHVIEDAVEVVVTLPGGEEYDATVIGTDYITDLALLKLDGHNFPYASLGDSDNMIIGEWVIALGNPFGLFEMSNQPTATAGIVSAINMDFGGRDSGKSFQDMIQTDAAINPGNSGGPLVNSLGEVIGINTFIFTGSDATRGSVGIGFAIPINKAKEIAEELKNNGQIDRSYNTGLQVQPLTERMARHLGISRTSGVIIVEVAANSTADKAGLEPGDVIVSVNDQIVNNADNIKDIILENDLRPGDRLHMKIQRDDKTYTVKLKLGKLENSYW